MNHLAHVLSLACQALGKSCLPFLKLLKTFPMSPRQREEFDIDIEALFSILHIAHMHRRGFFASEIRAFEEFMENAIHWWNSIQPWLEGNDMSILSSTRPTPRMHNQWENTRSSPNVESMLLSIREKLFSILKATQTFPMSPRQKEEFDIDIGEFFSILDVALKLGCGLFEKELRAFDEL